MKKKSLWAEAKRMGEYYQNHFMIYPRKTQEERDYGGYLTDTVDSIRATQKRMRFVALSKRLIHK